jgi:2-polyprenyl-6-methoxyphenol hydroxylase-like FAD-dependent oxidoreductase
VSVTEDVDTGRTHSVVEDVVTSEKITVISRYLCGADGARSRVAREIQLPFVDESAGALAMNVFVEADMVRRRYFHQHENSVY